MEDFIITAESRITDMKIQLDTMREIQSHPVKTSLQNAIKRLESTVAAVKEQLSALRTYMIEGCKNAIAAFRQGGIRALDKVASYLHIKSGLRIMKNDLVKSVGVCDKAVSDISAFAREYHSAGRAVKNMARMFIGKAPINAKKEAGKLARAMSFPYRAEKSCLLAVKAAVDKAIDKMEQLEQSADGYRANRPAQSTLAAELAEGREKVQHRERERNVPERAPAALGAEI
jgi:cob(I)alamin adenosyltransferase